MPGFDQCEGYVRTPDRSFTGEKLDTLPGDWFTQLPEFPNHHAGAVQTRLLQASQSIEESRIVPVNEMTEDVHLIARDIGAHFDARNQREIRVPTGSLKGFG